MPTENDDPRPAIYREKTRGGTTKLTRTAARTEAARRAPKTHWEAQWIGVIRNYPKTPEAFEARRERGRQQFARLRAEGRPPTRLGVPDGWAGRKVEIATIKATAKVRAGAEITRLVENGTLEMDEEVGNSALRVAYQFIFDETLKAELRLKAIQVVADYTKSRPTKKIEASVSVAEQWLSALAASEQP